MDLVSKQAATINDPNFLQLVLDHLANGGELVELCQSLDISFPACLKWLRQDVQRREMYERALDDKDQWTINKVRRELRDLATYNLADMYDVNGELRPFHEFPDALKRAIVGIKKQKDGTVEIKFADKVKLLELLGKSAGMYRDRVEHSGKVTLESLVAASMGAKDE